MSLKNKIEEFIEANHLTDIQFYVFCLLFVISNILICIFLRKQCSRTKELKEQKS